MTSISWLLRCFIFLIIWGNCIVNFIIKIYRFLAIIYSKFIYRPRYTLYWRKRRFENNKSEIIKQYKIQAKYERKEAFNRLKYHVKNQISENLWERELYTIQYENQFWWLDYLRDEQGGKDNIYRVWKRNTLQHLFDL